MAEFTSYRQIRNGWGLVLAIGWIVWCWTQLDAEKQKAIKALGDCSGLLNSANCAVSHTSLDVQMFITMCGAILVSPLALIVTHYFARWRVRQDTAAEATRASNERAVSEARIRSESAVRMAGAENDAARSRCSVARTQLIHKLGAVNDLLELMEREPDRERQTKMRLGIAGALRDVVAGHETEDLRGLIAGDARLTVSLQSTLANLTTAGLTTSPEFALLKRAQHVEHPEWSEDQVATA